MKLTLLLFFIATLGLTACNSNSHKSDMSGDMMMKDSKSDSMMHDSDMKKSKKSSMNQDSMM